MMLALTSKRGMNLPKGTKVITPIAGFPATLSPAIQVGFTPIFVDIELESLNLDLDQVEQACIDHPDAKVITFAHVLGNPPNMDRLMEIIEKYNLIFLEDCCDTCMLISLPFINSLVCHIVVAREAVLCNRLFLRRKPQR